MSEYAVVRPHSPRRHVFDEHQNRLANVLHCFFSSSAEIPILGRRNARYQSMFKRGASVSCIAIRRSCRCGRLPCHQSRLFKGTNTATIFLLFSIIIRSNIPSTAECQMGTLAKSVFCRWHRISIWEI